MEKEKKEKLMMSSSRSSACNNVEKIIMEVDDEEVFDFEDEEKCRRGSEMTVEEAIERHVGSLGWSQVVQVLIVSLAWMFDAQSTLVTIFTDAQPSKWRCKPHPHPQPAAAASCNSNTTSHGAGGVCGLSPGSWEWVGGHGITTVAEWGLICDRKFLAAVPASLFFLGSLIGSGVYGRLADAYLGRKKTVVISCILASVTAFLTSFSPNLYVYALLRFANGFSRSGIGICCLVLSTEVVGRKWRGQIGQYGFFFFTFGFLSLPLIAYLSRPSWRNTYRILSLLPLPYSLLILLFVSESPRWLLVRGRAPEALDVLKKFATLNGRKLPDNLTLVSPNPSPIPAGSSGGSEVEVEDIKSRKRKSLWTTGWAAKRMVIVMVAGFGVGFVYYGVQLNVENLSFSLYVSAAINALMEIPALFIGSLLLTCTNRGIIFSGSIALAGVSCILCIFISGSGWGQLSIEAIGFMAASTAYDVLYIYCVELFPTNVRNFAVSMLRQALMLGASIAPLLVVVGRLVPARSFLMFGLLSVLSGGLGMCLPETRNAPLYETLEQQEQEEKLARLPSNDDSGLELGK